MGNLLSSPVDNTTTILLRFLNEGYCSTSGVTVTAEEACTFTKPVLVVLGIVNLADPTGVLLVLIMLELTGRRETFFSVVFLAAVFVAALFFCLGNAYLVAFSTLGRMTMGPIAFIPGILSAEYFPTIIRSFSISFILAFGNIGSVVGTFSTQSVYNLSPTLFLGVTESLVVLTGMCLVLLKKETKEIQLE